MERIDRVVFAVPGKPVGKGRPRAAKRGKFIQLYTPEKTASYESLVKLSGWEAMSGQAPLCGPLHATIKVLVVPPPSWSKKKRTEALTGVLLPETKPDLDNIVKSVLDALNDVCFFDDKQVARLYASKEYAMTDMVSVEIKRIGT